MKTFLFPAQQGNHASKPIFDTMEFVFKMKTVNLGPFLLKEDLVDTVEGIRACRQYGRTVGEMLGA